MIVIDILCEYTFEELSGFITRCDLGLAEVSGNFIEKGTAKI